MTQLTEYFVVDLEGIKRGQFPTFAKAVMFCKYEHFNEAGAEIIIQTTIGPTIAQCVIVTYFKSLL